MGKRVVVKCHAVIQLVSEKGALWKVCEQVCSTTDNVPYTTYARSVQVRSHATPHVEQAIHHTGGRKRGVTGREDALTQCTAADVGYLVCTGLLDPLQTHRGTGRWYGGWWHGSGHLHHKGVALWCRDPYTHCSHKPPTIGTRCRRSRSQRLVRLSQSHVISQQVRQCGKRQ